MWFARGFGAALLCVSMSGVVSLCACSDSGSPGNPDPDGAVGDGAAGDGQVETDATVDPCEQPLDEQILSQLTMTFFPPVIQMQPGQSRTMELGYVECCYQFIPVNACVTWSVDPTAGASIDANGLLTIDPSVANGQMFLVTADVEEGRRLVTAEVWIYRPEDNPFVGLFTEVGQFDCNQGDEFVPTQLIGELMFVANGDFALTWTPFEVYVDYWGTYSYDLGTGEITLTPTGGNYIPADVDGQGTFSFDGNGDLLLHDMFLGSPSGGQDPPACGHHFR